MPSVTIKLDKVCDGGNHVTVTMTGDYTGKFEFSREEIESADVVRKEDVAKLMLTLMLRGLTPVQMRNRLQTGVTLTIA